MIRVLKLLVPCLVLAGCATELVLEEGGSVANIPRQTSDSGHIVVETRLNGQGPFRFAIDTGATISVVYDRARARAGIEPTPGIQAHVLGMTGSGLFPVGEIDQLSIGEETWDNARVALLPETGPVATHVDGILGTDFLSRYGVLYSHQERVLRLYPRDAVAEPSYVGWSALKLHDVRIGDGVATVFAFDMHIAAERIPTMFDLGANFNSMNRQAARELDVLVRRPRNEPDVYGVTGRTEILSVIRVWRLTIDNTRWRNKEFLVGEFPVFEVLDIGRQPMAIAGTDFFGGRDFIIDLTRRRLLVKAR